MSEPWVAGQYLGSPWDCVTAQSSPQTLWFSPLHMGKCAYTARRRKARGLAKIIVGTIWLAHQDPPDSTGVWGVCGRGTSIWGISRALDGLNTVSQLLLLGTTATKGVPTGD